MWVQGVRERDQVPALWGEGMTVMIEAPVINQSGAPLYQQAIISLLRQAIEVYGREELGHVLLGDPLMTRVINSWLDPREDYGTYADVFAVATDPYCPPGEVWLVKLVDPDSGWPVSAATPRHSVRAAILERPLPEPQVRIVNCSTTTADYYLPLSGDS